MRSFILKSCFDISSHTDLITKLAQITDEDSAPVQGEEDISLLILLCSHFFIPFTLFISLPVISECFSSSVLSGFLPDINLVVSLPDTPAGT